MATPKTSITSSKKDTPTTQYDFVFGRINYIIMVAGLILLLLGYILLSGGGSDDPNTFNPAMFDSQRLVVAPILIFLGFVTEIVAIMYKGAKKKDNADSTNQEN